MSTAVVSFNVNEQVQQQTEQLPHGSNSSSDETGENGAKKELAADAKNLNCSEIRNSPATSEKQCESDAQVNHGFVNNESKTTANNEGTTSYFCQSSMGKSLDSQSGAGFSGAAEIEEEEVSILPGPLRDILSEVARTGESESLSWDSIRKRPPPTEDRDTKTDIKNCISSGNSSKFSNCTTVAPVAIKPRAAASFLAVNGSGSAKNVAVGSGPPRKKQRNGIHSTSHRKSRQHQHLKRPFHLIRGSLGGGGSSTTTATVTLANPSVAASGGRFPTAASGSEPDDASQYDSEGTSATSNSELSFDPQKNRHLRHRSQRLNLRVTNPSPATRNVSLVRTEESNVPLYASSLRDAFRVATELVLDAWFNNKGGYKLSPAEMKTHNDQSVTTKDIFMQRKERLLKRLGALKVDLNQKNAADLGAPPFTIQRLAEVLVSPEKYYSQTHKLCNCLEKLLLVSSPITAFGGSLGGITAQSRREEQELAALTDERIRIQSEFRQLRKRNSLASILAKDEVLLNPSDENCEVGTECADAINSALVAANFPGVHDDGAVRHESAESLKLPSTSSATEADRREQLEAAARASLRSKFDHVGIDPHHQNHALAVNTNTQAITENRGLAHSPPPPNLTAVPYLSGGLFRSPHATSPGEHSNNAARPLSPILFNSNVSSPTAQSHALSNPNMHILQMHHAAAVAGVSPFELMALGTAPGSVASPTAGALLGSAQLNALKEQDVESRSSASSDVDSESDDISFDDSASDRSDGSDSGFVANNNNNYNVMEGVAAASSNFSAVARAMALKRHQQTTRAAAASQQLRPAPRLPPSSTTNAEQNGPAGIQDSSPSTSLMSGPDEPVPEDSDVSDSSLSDMAE